MMLSDGVVVVVVVMGSGSIECQDLREEEVEMMENVGWVDQPDTWRAILSAVFSPQGLA